MGKFKAASRGRPLGLSGGWRSHGSSGGRLVATITAAGCRPFLAGREVWAARLLDLRLNAATPETAQEIKGDTWDKLPSTWTPDSAAILFESNPQQKWGIFKYDLQTKQTAPLVVGPDSYRDPVVSSDGQWLLLPSVLSVAVAIAQHSLCGCR
jgi:hypothetical protein